MVKGKKAKVSSCRPATERIAALSAAGLAPAEVEEQRRARRGGVTERCAEALGSLQKKHGLIRKWRQGGRLRRGSEAVRETETLPRRLRRLLARRQAALGGRTQLLAAEKAPVVLSQ